MATCQHVLDEATNKRCGKHVRYDLMPIKTDTIVNMIRVYARYCRRHSGGK